MTNTINGKLILAAGLAFFFSLPLKGQQTEPSDTIKIEGNAAIAADSVLAGSADSLPAHSPAKASLLSAIVPGLGQAYNHKFWKIPVIYAGLGTVVYFASDFHKKHKLYKNAYLQRLDSVQIDPDPFAGLRDDDLKTLQSSYRRYRDLMFVVGFAVYVANVVDAAVDAHLYTFDVDENLSFFVLPPLIPFSAAGTTAGIRFKF